MWEKGSRGRSQACLAPCVADAIALAPQFNHRRNRHNLNALRQGLGAARPVLRPRASETASITTFVQLCVVPNYV